MNKAMLLKQYMMYSPKKSGGRLPSGFQEVEYIESTGTQYIDTGVKATNKTKFKIDVEMTAYDTYIFGAWNEWQVSMFTIYSANSSSSAIGYGSNWVGIINGITTGNKITLSIDNGVVKYNDEIKGTFSDTFTSTNNIILCGTNAGGTPTAFSKIKIYSLEIDGHNFIPCYRKSDNEVGLYDIVGNQFYTNAGSGKFLMGRPLVYDTIQGYQQVDYIEKQYSASNSSYFDSGIPASNDLVVEAELFNEIGTTDGSCAVFGSRIGFKNKDYTLNFANAVSNGTKYDSRFGSNAYNYGSYLVEYPNNYHILTWGNGALKINGETKLTMTNDSFESTLNVFLFAGNSNGSVGFFEGSGKTKVKWLKMTKNGVLVRNFIPMERTSDGELGMYDLVTNTFYTNQGSGEFISGGKL